LLAPYTRTKDNIQRDSLPMALDFQYLVFQSDNMLIDSNVAALAIDADSSRGKISRDGKINIPNSPFPKSSPVGFCSMQ
jgi:hypothetical protein